MSRTAEDFFEYDCPVQGLDFDLHPVPIYGSMINCSACGGRHRADESLGVVWRPSAEGLVDVTADWAQELLG